MRVVHLDTGRELRGGQRQVLLLHGGLLARGVDSLVVAVAGSPLARRCRDMDWPLVTLPGRRPWQAGVLRGLRRDLPSAHVVHVHDPHAATLAVLAVGRTRPPLVICHRRSGFALRRGPLHRLKYRRVDRWIAVTAAIRDALVAWGVPPQRVATIHSALDVDEVRAAAAAGLAAVRRELASVAGSPLVIAVAALDRQKGVDVLLRAMAKVVARRPDARLVVVGEGPERRALTELATTLGISARVRLVGQRDDVPAMLAAATVCVVPSTAAEGSSAVVKEAMVVGCPLLASGLSGLEEVAGEAADWFPPGDDDALAVALLELLDAPAAALRRVEAGHRRVARFGVGACLEAVLTVYRNGLEGVS